MSADEMRSEQISQLVGALSNGSLNEPQEKLLASSVDDLELFPRTKRLLKQNDIFTVGELVTKTVRDIENSTLSSLIDDIQDRLAYAGGLYLGMNLEARDAKTADVKVNPIHGSSEIVGGEILTSGAVVNFSDDKQASRFASAVKLLASQNEDIASFHVKRLPVHNDADSKTYPVYLSDEALAAVTQPEVLQKIATLIKTEVVAASRG